MGQPQKLLEDLIIITKNDEGELFVLESDSNEVLLENKKRLLVEACIQQQCKF